MVLSSLMFNTVSCIEQSQQIVFKELCEYFFIVLHCVEWPNNWKKLLAA